jgi:hypothetical protein
LCEQPLFGSYFILLLLLSVKGQWTTTELRYKTGQSGERE